jgi:hypothetical protein
MATAEDGKITMVYSHGPDSHVRVEIADGTCKRERGWGGSCLTREGKGSKVQTQMNL